MGFEDTNRKKETGLPLKLALEMLKKEYPDLVNTDVLMVGDSMERDLLPAKKLGLKTAFSRYGKTREEPGAGDYELLGINDITKIV